MADSPQVLPTTDPLQPIKPGWKTSEFYLTLIAQIVPLLVLVGLIGPADVSSLESALTTSVSAIFSLLSAAWVLVNYIKQRQQAKSDQSALKSQALNIQRTLLLQDNSRPVPLQQQTKPQFDVAHPLQAMSIEKALGAGVPWGTILTWILTYGPQLVTLIDNLIAQFKVSKATPISPS